MNSILFAHAECIFAHDEYIIFDAEYMFAVGE
ncbi:unknown [Parabacteroides sp. CAG:409]|nr:unknown [Parabacteroides sp. CAG:409]